MGTIAPREGLIRANFEQRAAAIEGRTMTGYPVVFDTWTEINSWEGKFRERVGDKALTKTLRENRDQIKVLFNHGYDPQIGDKPLGKPERMTPDATGLNTATPLSQTSYNDDLIALINDRAIDGMSFRFSVVNEQWTKQDTKMPERTITELKLYEFGPVTFPAYQATTVGLRSRNAFSAWLGLDDDRRNQIALVMGFDLRTLDTGAGQATPIPGAARTNDSEPLGAHSGVTIIRRRASGAADLLRRFADGNSTS